jgi:integrase
MLAAMEYNTHRSFTLLRTGMLPDDVARQVVRQIVPAVKKTAVDEQIVETAKVNALSAVIKEYINAKQHEWTEKSKMEFGCVLKLLQDILGDVEVKSITRAMVLELRSTLMKLPTNMYKKHPGKTIQEILSTEHTELLSIKSVNKHVSRLGAILRYCVDEGLITSNPASGLKISENKRVDEERSVYDKADIAKLIRALPIDTSTPERYWIPLIGLYSGMRQGEICQLYVDDIQQYDDIWCFNVNDSGDKRVKNLASKRIVPVHPVLLNKGFIDYVEGMRTLELPRLWMNLTWMDIHGYSNSFGKWYQRFNRRHVTKDPLKVFHSMRHTVADTLKQAGVLEIVISEVVGHTHQSMTTGRYGKRYQPKVLLEALMQLDYGVELPVWEI